MRHARFVALVAGHCGMCACQRKIRSLVLCYRVERAMKVAYGVARFAAIVVGRPSKLSVVRILMAISAGCEFHLVNRVFTGRQMALGAFHLCVFAFQRILRSAVFLHAEERRLPPIDGVAFAAFAFLRTLCKLAVVNVFVTVRTIRERQRLLEVTVDVAGRATNRGVLAQEGILRFRVIESEAGQLFPAGRGVASFATLWERAPVRVNMAIRACAELHVAVSRRAVRLIRFVTLFANYLDVQAG